MITEYVTTSGPWRGTCLILGRVPRSQIDGFLAENPEPEAPMKRAEELGVKIWALPDEKLPDRKDPTYVAELIKWRQDFSRKMFSLLGEAITVPLDDYMRAGKEFVELRRSGVAVEGYTEKASVLLSSVLGADVDFDAVCELVQYNSTVTLRGLVEAAKAYNVRIRGRKVPVAVLGESGKATANGVYSDRVAAQWARYRWADFCELTGPEQSAEVALFRISRRLERLMSKR